MAKPRPFSLSLVSFAVLACVACGSDFKAGGSAGATGDSGGSVSDGGSGAQAGAKATGGDTSRGAAAGDESSAGDSSTAGRATGGGGAAHGGAASGGASSGGGSAGGAAGSDCAALKTEYAALVKKARVCDKDSTDECTTESTAPAVGCGCPTLLNVKSESTPLALDKYKAIQKANCDNGPVCNIACLPVTSASCAQSTGAGASEFVCTGQMGGIAN